MQYGNSQGGLKFSYKLFCIPTACHNDRSSTTGLNFHSNRVRYVVADVGSPVQWLSSCCLCYEFFRCCGRCGALRWYQFPCYPTNKYQTDIFLMSLAIFWRQESVAIQQDVKFSKQNYCIYYKSLRKVDKASRHKFKTKHNKRTIW